MSNIRSTHLFYIPLSEFFPAGEMDGKGVRGGGVCVYGDWMCMESAKGERGREMDREKILVVGRGIEKHIGCYERTREREGKR